MRQNSQHFRVSSRTQPLLRNNVLADSAADAAWRYFTRFLGRSDIVVQRSEGPGEHDGHYAAYERKGTELVAIRKVESVYVQPTYRRPF